MKKKLNLIVLGLILGATSFGAEIGDFELKVSYKEKAKTQSVSEWISEHEYRIVDNDTGIEENARYIGKNFVTSNKNKEELVQVNSKIEIVEKGIGANETSIGVNAGKIGKNEKGIESNSERLDKVELVNVLHETNIIKINEKMAIHQAESDVAIKQLEDQDERLGEADKKFKETDEQLIKADARIEANVKELERHDDAVYETVGTTRGGIPKDIKAVKADINRDMILALQNGSTKVVEETNVKVDDNTVNIATNTAKTEVNETNISNNKTAISDNSQRITNLDNKVDNLQGEMNKGFAMSAAMTSVDFQSLEVGEMGIGAGVGNYQNAQAVSLGLGLRATENLSMNVKGAMSTGTKQETMVGAGATYKIKIFGS